MCPEKLYTPTLLYLHKLSAIFLFFNLSYAGHNNGARCPILHQLCSRLSAPASGPSVCLGLQGQQENGGGLCREEGGGAGGRWAARVWRGSGEVYTEWRVAFVGGPAP